MELLNTYCVIIISLEIGLLCYLPTIKEKEEKCIHNHVKEHYILVFLRRLGYCIFTNLRVFIAVSHNGSQLVKLKKYILSLPLPYRLFVLFLKKLSPLFKKYPKANCRKRNSKYGNNSVGYASLKVLIKTCKILFQSITQKLLGFLKF